MFRVNFGQVLSGQAIRRHTDIIRNPPQAVPLMISAQGYLEALRFLIVANRGYIPYNEGGKYANNQIGKELEEMWESGEYTRLPPVE